MKIANLIEMDGVSSVSKIRDLELEVLRLETKLRDLHTSDGVADKRALNTLQQHASALKQESQGVSEIIAGIDVDPFSQKVVEQELGVLSGTMLATYVGDRLLKASKVLEAKELRGALWTVSATYMVWRVTFGFWQKFKQKNKRNISLKADLDERYEQVQNRIDIMSDLVPQVPPIE